MSRLLFLFALLDLTLSCSCVRPQPHAVAAAPPARPAAPVARIADGAFVRVAGPDFQVGGRRFAFVGANIDVLHGRDRRASMEQVLAAMEQDVMTVARQWVLGEDTAEACEKGLRDYLFRCGPESFVEESYVQLDRLLVAARSHGIRLILTLANHWKDHGGIPMYLKWAALPTEGLAFEAFYSNALVASQFRLGIDRLLDRINTVNGVRYRDDPTIFSWELMNESTVLTAAGAEARRGWIANMAAYIKARDPNHLVAPGLLGYAMRSERREWIRVHQLPGVDYCDSHLYPQEESQVGSWERLRDFLDDRAQLARFVVGKPLVLGEFGFHTDTLPSWLGQPRAEWFARLVAQANLDGFAGSLVWIYQPFFGKARNYGIYVDRTETDDVRAALREGARQLAAAALTLNPRLAATGGDALLYEPELRLLGQSAPHQDWKAAAAKREKGVLLRIPPDAFAEAVFERAGAWKGGTLEHVYGAGSGHFVYQFTLPRMKTIAALQIRARLSSEWPGTIAPPDGGSPLRVLLDGQLIAALPVIPDDGIGRLETLTVQDPALLRTLMDGIHTLTFEVPDSPESHGLCIYGVPTGVATEPRPPVGEYPPIELLLRGGARPVRR